MAETIHDRLVWALTKRGAKPSTTVKSSKYTVLTHPTRAESFYFVGRAGALRIGRTTSNTVSAPGFRDSLLRLG